MEACPQALTEGIVHEPVGSGIVIYAAHSQSAHSLQESAKLVWERCDGLHTAEQIALDLQLEPAVVDQTLRELRDCGLLVQDTAPQISRRSAMRRIATATGAAIVAAPLISTVAIPPATAAASTCTNIGQACFSFYANSTTCQGTPTTNGCANFAGCTCVGTCLQGGGGSFISGGACQ
ncbi:MAG TPA: PqqD family protein [Solirubrobacteraceae bacterium]